MPSPQSSDISALIAALASGSAEIIGLTQPLTETTPVIQLSTSPRSTRAG